MKLTFHTVVLAQLSQCVYSAPADLPFGQFDSNENGTSLIDGPMLSRRHILSGTGGCACSYEQFTGASVDYVPYLQLFAASFEQCLFICDTETACSTFSYRAFDNSCSLFPERVDRLPFSSNTDVGILVPGSCDGTCQYPFAPLGYTPPVVDPSLYCLAEFAMKPPAFIFTTVIKPSPTSTAMTTTISSTVTVIQTATTAVTNTISVTTTSTMHLPGFTPLSAIYGTDVQFQFNMKGSATPAVHARDDEELYVTGVTCYPTPTSTSTSTSTTTSAALANRGVAARDETTMLTTQTTTTTVTSTTATTVTETQIVKANYLEDVCGDPGNYVTKYKGHAFCCVYTDYNYINYGYGYVSARDCCIKCYNDPNCATSFWYASLQYCYGLTYATCDGSKRVARAVAQNVAAWTVSNGKCGQIVLQQ